MSALLLGVGTGISYAYLTDRDRAGNLFSAAEVDIEIREEFTPPGELSPGMVIPKNPRIVSRSGTDCYVRAKICFSDSRARQQCQPIQVLEGWTQREDGYYYWHQKLKPGETTGVLFDQVEIRQDAAKEELLPFDLLVYGEAVACGGRTEEEAWVSMKKQ